jgi:hypothetical protein
MTPSLKYKQFIEGLKDLTLPVLTECILNVTVFLNFIAVSIYVLYVEGKPQFPFL